MTLSTLMEMWREPGFDHDAALCRVLELVAQTAPTAPATVETEVLVRALQRTRFDLDEPLLRAADARVRALLGIGPEATDWEADGTQDQRVASILLNALDWCLDSENLGFESAVEFVEELLVSAGLSQQEAAATSSRAIRGP